MKTINLQTVLVDIDGTLVENFGSTSPLTGSKVMADILYMRDHIPRKETLRKLSEIFDPGTSTLSAYLPLFKVTEEELWPALLKNYQKHSRVFPDAAVFLQKMQFLELPVYTASTNGAFTARLKLGTAGLAGATASPYITGYFPGNAFEDPRGKYDPDYFCKIIQRGKFNPAMTMMVGDEIEHDLLPALRANIRYVVIVNRHQTEDIILRDGGIFVNSLDRITDSVRKVQRSISLAI